ncbi:hypothetical protein KDC22_15720 [Paenibacillus tritici]|nr:hypothetical protein [Paenibacillus tritici]QUL57799.1 hypothetical protein KDC22_15720 [Paenibacillus tritici]
MFSRKKSIPLFTRKISGPGWTLHPAHPVTWIVVGALLGVSIYVAFSR